MTQEGPDFEKLYADTMEHAYKLFLSRQPMRFGFRLLFNVDEAQTAKELAQLSAFINKANEGIIGTFTPQAHYVVSYLAADCAQTCVTKMLEPASVRNILLREEEGAALTVNCSYRMKGDSLSFTFTMGISERDDNIYPSAYAMEAEFDLLRSRRFGELTQVK